MPFTHAIDARVLTGALSCALLLGCGSEDTTSAPLGGAGTGAGGGGVGGALSSGGTGGAAASLPLGGSGGAGGVGGSAGSGGEPCTLVAHIGDSLTYYTQDELVAAYELVGVTAQIDAYGGRAIKQKLPDDPHTGEQAANTIREGGFSGCWVVALGTNDTANVAAGAWYTRAEAIDTMMAAVDPAALARVMWVNTHTTVSSGYYANDNMELWNDALDEATTRWSNLRVFDWAAIAATGVAPYADGIHHTTAGYDVRNAAIAEAVTELL